MLNILSFHKDVVKKGDLANLESLRHITYIEAIDCSGEELRKIAKKTGISAGDLNCCMDSQEPPRFEVKKGYYLTIYGAPVKDRSKGLTIPVGIFVGRRFILVVSKKELECLKRVRESIYSKSKDSIFNNGLVFVFSSVLSSIGRDFSDILEVTGAKIDDIEQSVIERYEKESIKQIFHHKKGLLYYRRVLNNNKNLLDDIRGNKSLGTEKNMGYWDHLHNELLQMINVAELYKERLTESTEIYLTSASNKLNESMKSFTVVAALFLIPVLISGIYGMNFREMPFLHHEYGFYIAIIIMVLGVLISVLFFKARKWI